MTTHTTIERKQEQNQHKHKDDNEINNETNVHGTQDAGVQTAQPHASSADVGQKKL
jgi:hypothetical protein